MDDLELYHHGIKGMKWGIRRTPEQLGHDTSTTKKVASTVGKAASTVGKKVVSTAKTKKAEKQQKKADEAEAERQKKLRKKPISELTDDELKERIARLELEKRYADLSPKTVKTGEDWVARALRNAGESSLKNLAEQTFDTLGGEGINRIAAAFTGVENPNDPNYRVVNARKRQTSKK